MKITAKDPKYFDEISEGLREQYPDIELVQLESADKALDEKSILVSEGQDSFFAVKTFLDLNARHLVQKNPTFFLEDVERTARLIRTPQKFLDSPADFVLPVIREKVELVFSMPKHKDSLIRKAEDFAKGIESQNAKESTRAIVEELCMNAIYSAP